MFRVVVSTLIILAITTPLLEAQTQQVVVRKEPGISLLISLFISGGGQFYNGDMGKGIIMLGTDITSLIFMWKAGEDNISFLGETIDVDEDDAFGGFMALVWLGNKIWSATNAYGSAKRLNLERGFTANLRIRELTLDSARVLCYPMCFRIAQKGRRR